MLTTLAHRRAWAFLWEHVTNPDIRDTIRAARGLCHTHTWLCYEIGNTDIHSLLGFSDVAADVIRLVVPDLAALAHGAHSSAECPSCTEDRRTTGHQCRQLVRSLVTPEAWQSFGQSPGLCTAHVAQIAMLLPEVDTRRSVYTVCAAQLDATRRQLDMYLHAWHGDAVEARRALRRALAVTTGQPCWPRPNADEQIMLPRLPDEKPACPLCRACAGIQTDGPLCARHAARRLLAATQTDEHLPAALRIARTVVERAGAATAALQAGPIERIT